MYVSEMPPLVGLASTCCSGSGSVVGATISAALQFFAASQCLVKEPWPHNPEITSMCYMPLNYNFWSNPSPAKSEKMFKMLETRKGDTSVNV